MGRVIECDLRIPMKSDLKRLSNCIERSFVHVFQLAIDLFQAACRGQRVPVDHLPESLFVQEWDEKRLKHQIVPQFVVIVLIL